MWPGSATACWLAGWTFAPGYAQPCRLPRPDWDLYVRLRTQLERHASANRESVWNGRPISLLLFDGLDALDGKALPMIELIPPVHQRVYKMGLEHLGVVVGDSSTPSSKPTSPC